MRYRNVARNRSARMTLKKLRSIVRQLLPNSTVVAAAPRVSLLPQK